MGTYCDASGEGGDSQFKFGIVFALITGMLNRRRAGILLHITSLPGRFGIGDLGDEAYRFVDFLSRSGQSIWQILPLGPTGYGDSPYQSFSAFAGNPLLISPERLVADGLLSELDLANGPAFRADRVDFETVAPWRTALLRKACLHSTTRGNAALRSEFEKFCSASAGWLDDYALFMALKNEHPSGAWPLWELGLRQRDSRVLAACRKRLEPQIVVQQFEQFLFDRQWRELKQYAHERGVLILGDVPIFVSHDSADVWSHQELFCLDADGNPSVVAGVPPDYFSEMGQRWGNPLYRWDALADSSFDWWIRRMESAFRAVDLVRIDHFRGFEAYWEIPADSPTAATGRWVAGPGAALFRALEARLGRLPILAEDLGVITPPVEELRDSLSLPGMRVLQFAFGDDPKATDYKPHHYPRHTVVYTGTHDNDTTVGWFRAQAGQGTTRTHDQVAAERDFALRYLDSDGTEIHWDLIRAAWASVANTAMAPMQDLLGLGTEARMNLPGSATGNWRWRLAPDLLTEEVERRLAELTSIYDRAP